MNKQEELKDLIKNVVLEDVDDYIDELLELIASKKDDENTKEELNSMQEMKKEFLELLSELEAGEIDDEEAAELIEEINDMLNEDID
ncbi:MULTISPECIES: hypothetical protein [Aliarcobacter]|jgi:uncharacterized protein YwgA|uniref:Uncharacterized protein n=2 Tax=Aliarcobacter skirrowii TaxID=28200 RepID=A0AAD0SNC8_9BACT|nr:hypothetical protein [Aliarcobacter skirrowii]AXX85278.1 hypothetical protein ASKIR_1486 [Aliarcobacter skirrowii CCUG 10374]AZL54312.1 hypothetical protein EI285_06865 [Aliarcobacter skirrowii]KAB0620018.1 hypothetical protein F7P70_09000 [Aliarcobacter skirrowii CCUG 10374]MCT7447102.1 hypothetical protein [Aliarcobacter skirrowii]MDD2508911.1 hypothetical protein [Aliarcobacter skirrowii]